MKVLIFGGTTEGRLLAQALSDRKIPAAVSVATELGAEELAGLPGIVPLVGRKNREEMRQLLRAADRCVDATHPYAREVSQNIRAACEELEIPLRRLLRAESELPDGAVQVDSAAEAAQFLQGREGNILLSTGAKELPAFAGLERRRLYPRVLPVEESVAACHREGIPSQNIIALHGPFSKKLNEAILEQYGIRWLVTKDGGAAGGFAEKAAAAQSVGAALVVIRRPAERGESLAEILRWLCSAAAEDGSSSAAESLEGSLQ